MDRDEPKEMVIEHVLMLVGGYLTAALTLVHYIAK